MPTCHEQPSTFLRHGVPVIARMPTLEGFTCTSIGNSLHLRQIGAFIGMNPGLKQVALSLHVSFWEEIIPDGPEGLGYLIRAIIKTRKDLFQALPSPAPYLHQFCLRDLRLSSFAMDEDAEKGLSFLLCHCPLETLMMRDIAAYKHLTTFFRSWRRPEALSCLRHLIFETDTINEHAIDFSALAKFLIYLGTVPHRIESLEFLGGWRLLNMEVSNIEALKASPVLGCLRTLIWESCVARWCNDCEFKRATRSEMIIFANLACRCPNIVVLGLPGLFITSPGSHAALFSEEDTEAILHQVTRLRCLQHLHVQQTDELSPAWSTFAGTQIGTSSDNLLAGELKDHDYLSMNSPTPGYDLADAFFYSVARSISMISIARIQSLQCIVDPGFFSITFGLMKFWKVQQFVWSSKLADRFWDMIPGPPGSEWFEFVETFKSLPPKSLQMRFSLDSLTASLRSRDHLY